jgi:hypothetical protein
LPPPRMSLPDDLLSGGFVDLGDRARFLHARHGLGSAHKNGRFGGLDGAARGYRQCDSRHTFIVRDIGDDDEIVVTEAVPTSNKLTPDGLARSAAYGVCGLLSWAAQESAT